MSNSNQDHITSENSQQEEICFEEEKSLHHYRTEIPNCILFAKLSANEFLVYCHVKRIAGDKGKCFMSHRHISEISGICEKTVRTCLDSLSEKNQSLGVVLIRKTKRRKENGSLTTCVYTIVDVWPLNMKLSSQNNFGTVKFTEGVRYNLPKGTVKFTDNKEEPLKKNPIKNNTTPTPQHLELPKAKQNGGGGGEKIFFKNKKGERDFAFRKDAFLYTLNYPTAIVEEAITCIENDQPIIINFKKYLLAICDRLVGVKQNKSNETFIRQDNNIAKEEYKKKVEEHKKRNKSRIVKDLKGEWISEIQQPDGTWKKNESKNV